MKKCKIVLTYITPLIFLLVGGIALVNILLSNYMRAISFIDWLWNGPTNLLDVAHDTDMIMSYVYRIIFTRVFWFVWLIGFVMSLYLLGHHLHNKKDDISRNGLLHGNQAVSMFKSISDKYTMILQEDENKNLSKKMKILSERFSYESEFGYGNDEIISCENLIKCQLDILDEYVDDLYIESTAEKQMNILCVLNDIDVLLSRRADMKKRFR